MPDSLFPTGLDGATSQVGPIREGYLVIHVIDSLGRSGGAEQQLVANLHHFSDRRLSHGILCLYRGDTSREADVPPDVRVSYLRKGGARTHSRLIRILRVWRQLRRLRPDLVHCALPDASLGARLAGRFLDIPVIESLVNISHEEARITDNRAVKRWKLRAHRAVDRWTMRKVAKFHAISQEVAHSWIRTIGISPTRIQVIPRGVEIDNRERTSCRDRLLRELSIGQESFVILNVGRQVPQKGQIYAVKAMAQILDEIPGAVLVSAGSSGSMSDVLRVAADGLAVADKVFWLGIREDIEDLMAAADAFVFPSLYEGLGVSLLQAMAAGLACVVTDRPPMTEVVSHEESGILVPPRDPNALAAALIRLARDEELRGALAAAARMRVRSAFNPSDVAARIERLYRETLRGI